MLKDRECVNLKNSLKKIIFATGKIPRLSEYLSIPGM